MKKIIVLLLSLLLITGCQNEEVSTKTAYATYYPLEYATNYMYSSFAKVKSIYPNGIDTKSYELTEKQKGIYFINSMSYYDFNLYIYSNCNF